MKKTATAFFSTFAALFAAALAALPSAAAVPGADSAPFLLDTMPSPRIATEGEAEPLAYSPRWGGAASCSISADGARVLSGATADGTLPWTPRGTGRHALAFEAGATRYAAAFTVLGDDVALHGGVLAAGETWPADKTHLVTAPLTVPSGVTLTIAPGAVVKFLDGTSLTIASGGACIARGVIFTHVADDTAGGDTMMDGDETTPAMGRYTITGSVTDNDSTEYRYMPPQTLTSSITSDTRLRGHRCYIVSNSVTVASGATLTLQPGTVLKFNTGCQLTVNGTLSALGTRAQPIVFTSLRDDDHGGDTNGDGDATYAQPGDWHQITGNGTVKLDYCQVLWCSAQNNQGALYPNGGTWTFDNSIVAHCEYDCMRSYGGTFTARNSIFMDSSMGAAPSSGTARFDNCVFYDLTTAVRWGNGTFNNSVFAGITQDIIDTKFYSSTLNSRFSHCCFWAPNATGDKASAKVGTSGNVWGDPLFLDPDNGDFRIASASSPCVDAADSSAAPETDYYGQGRLTARYAPTGVPDALGHYADIGIHEFLPSGAAGLYDLAAAAVSTTAATAAPGSVLSVSWTVRNAGKRAVRDSWHDALALVSDSGRAYALGEPLNPGVLDAGEERSFSATFAVPVVPAGSYRLRFSVNSRRAEVAEGSSTANNAVLSKETLAVAIPATTAADGATGNVAPGAAQVVAFDIPAGSGDLLLRVAAPAGGASLSGRCGLGFLPVEGGSGAALVFAGGEAWLSVPAGTETVYLVLENSGASEASFAADFRAGSLSVAGVSPTTLPASGKVTLQIAGAGFADGCTVTLGDSSAAVQAVRCVSASLLAVRVDCAKLAAGSRPALSVRKGAETKTLANALTVTTAAGKGKFWAKLSVPESVREGRLVSTCFVEYGNSGTADVLAPVLQVSIDGNGTLGYIGGLSGQKTLQFVAAGDEGSAGVLRPGASRRIRFALRAGSRNSISLHSSVGSDYHPSPWTTAASYLSNLSAAATRIGLAEQNPIDFEQCLRVATIPANQFCVSGRVFDRSNIPLSGVNVMVTNATDVIDTYTDAEGRFFIIGVPTGNYSLIVDRRIAVQTDMHVGETDKNLGAILVDLDVKCVARVEGMSLVDSSVIRLYGDDVTMSSIPYDDAVAFYGITNGVYTIEYNDGDKIAMQTVSIGRESAVRCYLNPLKIVSNQMELPDDDNVGSGSCYYIVGENGIYYEGILTNDTRIVDMPFCKGKYWITIFNEGQLVVSDFVEVAGVDTRNVSSVNEKNLRKASALLNSKSGPSEHYTIMKRALDIGNEALAYSKSIVIQHPTEDFACEHNIQKMHEDEKRLKDFRSQINLFDIQIRRVQNLQLKRHANATKAVFLGMADAIAEVSGLPVTFFNDIIAEASGDGEISFETLVMFGINGGLAELKDIKVVTDAAGHKIISKEMLEKASHIGSIMTAYGILSRFLSLGENATEVDVAHVALSWQTDDFEKLYNRFKSASQSFNQYPSCCQMRYPEQPYDPPIDNKTPSVPQSCDPNEMKGPEGTGVTRALIPGEAYEWTIYFENLTNATAAASEVRVTAQLSDQLDWTTFETLSVSFGDETDVGLLGKANGTSDHLVPGTNYTVHSEVQCDAETGIVSWYLRIVDPDGDEEGYPIDPTAGFLPPNNPETHCGEGSITYSVAVRVDATPGAQINAAADIKFDGNPIIPTDPAWWNTVGGDSVVVAFDANGGEGEMAPTADYGHGAALPECSFTRDGHAFVGWATRPDGAVRYLDGSEVSALTTIPGATVTLYAVWADESDTALVRDGDDLQATIDAAPDGGLVLVYPGTYSSIEIADKAVEIRAVFGPGSDAPDAAPTIIDGGGVARCATLGDDAVLSGFILRNGVADFGGGALGGVLGNCVIENCAAVADDEGGGLGGGAYGSTLSRCIVTNCTADVDGGGLYECAAENAVIAFCEAGGLGGGAYHATLTGCTVYGCGATAGAGVAGCQVANSIVWENRLYATDKKGNNKLGNCANVTEGKKTLYKNACTYTDSSPKPAGTGNLAKDPLFVDAANGDFRLQWSSPVKNKGKAALAAGELDLGGLPRLVGAPDMGAHESADGTPVPADYDGDGVTDAAYFDAATATWIILQSRDGLLNVQFGDLNGTPVPADYDGDGKADFATYLATAKAPVFRILTQLVEEHEIALGEKGATPFAADIDGDGLADPGVFQGNAKKPAFTVLQSTRGWSPAEAFTLVFGTKSAKTFIGDFDGDGKADLGCYTSTASKPVFKVALSGETWSDKAPLSIMLGAKGSEPCCGDFDGDGVMDFAAYSGTAKAPLLYRMFSTSKWREVRTLPFGEKGSRAVTADWDGDGAADAAIEFRSSWWRVTRDWDVKEVSAP